MVVSSRGLMISSVLYDAEGETRSERLWRERECGADAGELGDSTSGSVTDTRP